MKDRYNDLELKIILFAADDVFLQISGEGEASGSVSGGTSGGFNDGYEEDFID